MKRSRFVVWGLCCAGCLSRNMLGAELEPFDAGTRDASQDAAIADTGPSVDGVVTAKLVEACMQGAWKGTASWEGVDDSETMAWVSFRSDQTFDLRCEPSPCTDLSGRWAITDVGPDRIGAGSLELPNSLLPVYIDAVDCAQAELSFALSNLAPVSQVYKLVRDPDGGGRRE